MTAAALDPVALAQRLVRIPSVTPHDGGAIAAVAEAAASAGFTVETFVAGEADWRVTNLVASRGQGRPRLAFAGHTDVVPTGPADAWRVPPFAGVVADGRLIGRGAADMKGAIAAFLAAAARTPVVPGAGTLQLLVTGDEEDGRPPGMRAIIDHLRAADALPDACLIGEGSNAGYLGQGLRVGRRGSLNVDVEATGVQGHVAWPQVGDNAAHTLTRYVAALLAHDFGAAETVFPATSLQITRLAADSGAGNVIPGAAAARLNLRFNRRHSGAGLVATLTAIARATSPDLRLRAAISGEPYLAEAPALVEAVTAAVVEITGHTPEHNAGGGVSDGRFLHAVCPVVEFGLVGDTAHQVDESTAVADIHALAEVYAAVLRRWGDAARGGHAAG